MIGAGKAGHVWRFFRAGDFDQVRLDTGADLLAIEQLDLKLWVALACPTSGLEFDSKTLGLIDTDKDGRVRAPELIAAVKWAGGLLKNPDDLVKGANALRLAAIDDSVPEGKLLLECARQILANLGKGAATEITLLETGDTARIFAQTAFNGDGIIVAESAADEATRGLIADILATQGAETDRSGRPGIGQGKVDAFFVEAKAFEAWVAKSETDSSILPLGAGTAGGVAAWRAVKGKVDDYFGRCRLAAFDPRATAALNREEKEYLAVAAKDMTLTAAEVAGFPLAAVGAGRSLPLDVGVNPAWAGAVTALKGAVVTPLLGARSELREEEWTTICARLAAYEGWYAARAGASVEKLGIERVRAVLAGKGRETLGALIAKDKAEEGNANAIAALEKLIRYHRDLHLLCTNFVNFKDFYDRGEPAIFQAGTLYLDQRSCGLCLSVEDAGKHAGMAALAGTYLAYCDCMRRGTGEKRQIVAAFTDGDSENLMVGRNGVFFDRKGVDWDATITKIIDNPISIRQAFWSPYKKFVRMVEEQIAKRAAAADAAATDKLTLAATQVAQADKTVKPAAKPDPKKMDVGMIAAMGVAFGSISTFLATVFTKFVELSPAEIVLVLLGIVALISGPSMLMAYLKLRKRNLGPLLDANGWAINAKAKINVPFGSSLTDIAKLPAGAQRDLTDPYAEKRSPWPKVVGAAVLIYAVYAILNNLGYIHEWTHGRMGIEKKTTTQGEKGASDSKTGGGTTATNAPAGPG
jgi:hypothetical protein